MQIMTLEEFAKTPNYTLFSVCTKKELETGNSIELSSCEGPFLKTGKYPENYKRDGWNGAIDLFGWNRIIDDKKAASNFCTWDNSDSDYTDDDDRFIVFEKDEIRQMIKLLLIAIGEGSDFPNDRNFYVDEKEITEKEIFKYDGITREEEYEWGVNGENIYRLLRNYLSSSK